MKADFLAYFTKMMKSKDQKWKVVYPHFFNFLQGQCTFGEVNVDLCKRFRAYLLNAKQLKHTEHKVSLNSAAGYYSAFGGLLKIAYRDKLLRENINDFLEKIEYEDVKKAKILKHITFHCFRHSYVTLLIAAGTDIYTVSKMLTHRNVSTTQIYAELVSEKKRESANKISLK